MSAFVVVGVSALSSSRVARKEVFAECKNLSTLRLDIVVVANPEGIWE